MYIRTCLELLSNSEALRRGELVLTQEFVADYLRSAIQKGSVKRLAIVLRRQHCLLDLYVGKAGLLYRWTNSLCLRAAELNCDPRHIVFEQLNNGRVGPANFAARAVLFAPRLLPDVSFIVQMLIRCILTQLTNALVRNQVSTAAKSLGVAVDGRRWVFDLSSSYWLQHPAFMPIEIPLLGERPLVGGVVVVKRLDLIEETLRLRIGLHPDIGNYLDAFGPAVSRLKSTLVGTGHDQVQQHNGVPGSSLSEKPNSASWSSLSKWISVARLMNSIADLGENSKIDPSTAVSDLEWAAELDTGPALDVADLDLDGVEALQLLDF